MADIIVPAPHAYSAVKRAKHISFIGRDCSHSFPLRSPAPGGGLSAGQRAMFPLISAATIVPVLFIGVAGQTSLAALLVGGFFLGVVYRRRVPLS